MECPYCAGVMQPDRSVTYWVVDGIRTADWMRCTSCEHACIKSSRLNTPTSTQEDRYQ